VGWRLWRRKPGKPDGELAAQHKETDARLSAAKVRRDTERRKLREEHWTLVQPMRRDREANHFAELASEALRQKRRR